MRFHKIVLCATVDNLLQLAVGNIMPPSFVSTPLCFGAMVSIVGTPPSGKHWNPSYIIPHVLVNKSLITHNLR
ncbi:MAG: hypothetical protein PWQ49_574 [Methanohalophilus sp.]|nr:hypothetical protein [Methanohalophilus sp.]